MKECPYCRAKVKKDREYIEEDGIYVNLWRCPKCKEGYIDMNQLHQVTEEYRKMKTAMKTKFNKWGNSLGIRISKKFLDELKIKPGDEAWLIKEKKGFRIQL